MPRDLQPNKMKKYGKYLEALIFAITETIHSHYLQIKETLFNIGTGKAASKGAFHLFFMSLVLETGLVKNL